MGESKTKTAAEQKNFFDNLAERWDSTNTYNLASIAACLSRLNCHAGSTVLDVGCGTGVMLPYLLERVGPAGRVYAIDLAPRMLAVAAGKYPAPNLSFIEGDAAGYDFGSLCFDTIVCHNVLPHFCEPLAGLAHLSGCLRPGGLIAVCHSDGREEVNARHRQVAAVAEDILPPAAALAAAMRAMSLTITAEIDTAELYLVIGEKR